LSAPPSKNQNPASISLILLKQGVQIKSISDSKETNCLILETKGFDPLAEVKRAAAVRWTKAVDTDGRYGHWQYAMAKNPNEAGPAIEAASRGVG
jgi:hypothetical protein